MQSPARSCSRTAALAVVLLVGLVGCSDETGSTSPSTTGAPAAGTTEAAAPAEASRISDLLGSVPATTLDEPASGRFVVYGNLDQASELAAASRPPAGANADDVIEWGSTITGAGAGDGAGAGGVESGPPRVVALLPYSVGVRLDQSVAFADEVGWNVLDVGSFLDDETVPAWFSVLTGVDPAAVTAALGPPVDGVWRIGEGADFESHIDDTTAARPLGVPLTEAAASGRFAVTPSSPAMQAWLTGGGPTLADDPAASAIAEALDAADVYSAQMQLGLPVSAASSNPFDAIGLGLSADATGAIGTIVYHYADDAAATQTVPLLTDLLRNGASSRTGQPWTQLVTLDTIAATGPLVTLQLRFPDGATPASMWSFLTVRDSIAAQG